MTWPAGLRGTRTKWRAWQAFAAEFGVRAAVGRSRARAVTGIDRPVWPVRPRGVRHPFWVRDGSSDLDVFRQMFVEHEYADLADLRDVDLVLDCGANVGYSSAYFLSRFPGCRVVAVEPDPANFAMLRRNLAPYGGRATCVRAGVWSHPARLGLAADAYRDGRDWARQVRPAAADAADGFDGIDIGSLLARSGCPRISLLKMDIEGAEAVVFAAGAGAEAWLPRVDALAVELHDDTAFGPATARFHEAVAGQGFMVTRRGDLTIGRRPRA